MQRPRERSFRVGYALITLWLAASAWVSSSAQDTAAAHTCASLEPSIQCGPCDVGKHEHSDSDQNRLYCASDDGECRPGAAGGPGACPTKVPVFRSPFALGAAAVILLVGVGYVLKIRTTITVSNRTDTTLD